MGLCTSKQHGDDDSPTARSQTKEATFGLQKQKTCALLKDDFHNLQHLDIHDFTPENIGYHARQYLELLALPLPVTLSLLCGGLLGSWMGFKRFLMWTIVFFGIFPVLYKYAMKQLGRKVKDYLELVDRDYLGVDVHIGELDLSICHARLVINDFQLDNPEGYKSDYLAKCKSVILDIDLLELVLSKGKKIVVEEFTLDSIDVIMEYDSVILGAGKSNVDVVMDFLSQGGNKDDDKAGKAGAGKEEKPAEPKKDDQEAEPAGAAREIIIQKVEIIDVGARVQSSIGIGPRAAVADVKYKHFTKQFGKSGVQAVIGIIVKSIFKSLLATVGGKAFADKSL